MINHKEFDELKENDEVYYIKDQAIVEKTKVITKEKITNNILTISNGISRWRHAKSLLTLLSATISQKRQFITDQIQKTQTAIQGKENLIKILKQQIKDNKIKLRLLSYDLIKNDQSVN